jgi:hypothetical protein
MTKSSPVSLFDDDEMRERMERRCQPLTNDEERVMLEKLQICAGIEVSWIDHNRGYGLLDGRRKYLLDQRELLDGQIQALCAEGIRGVTKAARVRLQLLELLERRLQSIDLALEELVGLDDEQVLAKSRYYKRILHECLPIEALS